MQADTPEQILVNALSRLQNVDIDKTLLADEDLLRPELILEQHFGFTIGRHHFLVKADCFCEVFTELPIAAIPNAPGILAGLCNVRGVLVPVYQLHREWSFPLPTRRYIFCVGKGDKTVGLLIDSLPGSLELGERDTIKDDTFDADDVLSMLVEKTYLSRGATRYRLRGEALASQLLILANARKREANGMEMTARNEQFIQPN